VVYIDILLTNTVKENSIYGRAFFRIVYNFHCLPGVCLLFESVSYYLHKALREDFQSARYSLKRLSMNSIP
ncbi:MAG TPA: hypothetical protein DD632_00770, partial [Oribacterium sp.]|nr:hypothetical protein [Oribacterium sp.]